MINMLYSVLFIERDLRPQAGVLIDTENFWICERMRRKNFPSNPAWSPIWPEVISFSAIGLVAGGLFYWHDVLWQDGARLLVALIWSSPYTGYMRTKITMQSLKKVSQTLYE